MKLIFLCIVLGVYAKEVSYEIDKQIRMSTHNMKKYKPEWDDLDTRPLPQWYDSAKIGIFLHWGVYSVPCFKSEWFWKNLKDGDIPVVEFMNKSEYHINMTYEEFAPMFKAEKFQPEKWAELFAESGAKYVVITAKHHDGFTLFPSGRPNWNSVDVGPKKDILDVLSKAVRKHNMKFGVYYSLLEWYNEFYLLDKISLFKTTLYPDNIVWPDLEYMIQNYKPSVVWFDGESEANTTYWKTPELLAWLYSDSPVKDEVVVNDRLGYGTLCRHGDIFNCDDKYNPRALMHHKWENAFPLDKKSWGYRREMQIDDVYTISEMLETIVSTVSCGGNVLLNIGPTKEGIIIPLFQDRLLKMGQWLDINGEAIYDTSPWFYQRDSLNPDVWYTCAKQQYHQLNPVDVPNVSETIKAVYAIFLKWPGDDILKIKDAEYLVTSKNWNIQLIKPKGYASVSFIKHTSWDSHFLPSDTLCFISHPRGTVLFNIEYKDHKHHVSSNAIEVNLTRTSQDPVDDFLEGNMNAWVLKFSIGPQDLKT